MQSPSIAILILFFEKAQQTIATLRPLVASNIPIYLLDNGSSAGQRAELDRFVRDHAQIIVLDEPENIGVGPGRNRLIKETHEDWLFFLDNDIVVKTRDWLPLLVAQIERYPAIEAFVPRLYNVHNRQWQVYSTIAVEAGRMQRYPVTGPEINNFPGGATLVNRSVFARLGLYDQDIFVGGEDYELNLRGILSGMPVRARLVESVILDHHHQQAKDSASLAAAEVRYDMKRIARSMACIEQKHGIHVDRGWERWVPVQLSLMTRGEPLWQKLTRSLKSWLRKLT